MKYFFLLLVLFLSACQQGSKPGDSTAPVTPKGLNLVAGNQKITLSWTANTETDLASYVVYWGVSADISNKISVAKDKTTYEITELENERPYFVALSAIDKNGNESKKTSTSTATRDLPAATVVLTSSVTERTTLDPFTLSVQIENFPDVNKVEFYKDTELIGSDETVPYEITVVSDQFGSYTDSYIAKAISSSGESINSNAVSVTTNVAGQLLVFPNNPIILAGGSATPFETYLQEDGGSGSESISVTWTLEGPGSLSATEGIRTEYTPPATLDTETTATMTGTLPDGRSAQSVITLRPATPAGNLYYVRARVRSGVADVSVFENSTRTVFPSALVEVNSTTIPFTSGRFQGFIPSIAPGESVNLEITVPEGVIRALVIMPSAPNLTAPASGSSVSAANPLDISWEIAENPTKFSLNYDTDPYESDLSVSVNPSGDSRNYSFTGIPANKTLVISVSAVNEQTELTGPVALDSGSILFAENFNPSSFTTITTTP